MNKKTIGILATATLIPIATVVSCSKQVDNNLNDFGIHSYLYEEAIQDSKNNIRVSLNDLSRDEIRSVPVNIPSHYGANIAAGGFGEKRKFYSTPSVYHVGMDIFVQEGTKILAPAKGEIITAVWRKSKAATNFAQGSGGNIVMKVNINDLDISQEAKELVYIKSLRHQKTAKLDEHPSGFYDDVYYYTLPKLAFIKNNKYSELVPFRYSASGESYSEITKSSKSEYDEYINKYVPENSTSPTKDEVIESSNYLIFSLMHLSKASIMQHGEYDTFSTKSEDSIANKKTYENKETIHVEKGEVIGTVGGMDENGGWPTHTHVGVYSPSIAPSSGISVNRIHRWFETTSKLPIFGIGTYGDKDDTIERHYSNWDNFATVKGFIDPNNIYKFYDENTRVENITV